MDMENDDKKWGKPPAGKVDDLRDRVTHDMDDRMTARIRMSGCRKDRWGSLVPGAVILAVGLIFLLDSMGYVRARHFFQFWPMILIFVGASKIFRHDSRVWGVLLLLFA